MGNTSDNENCDGKQMMIIDNWWEMDDLKTTDDSDNWWEMDDN